MGTTIYAKCPVVGEMRTFAGPHIKAPTQQLAHEFCQQNGLGYCHVEGELIAEIPCKEGTYDPDFKNMIDYENTSNN